MILLRLTFNLWTIPIVMFSYHKLNSKGVHNTWPIILTLPLNVVSEWKDELQLEEVARASEDIKFLPECHHILVMINRADSQGNTIILYDNQSADVPWVKKQQLFDQYIQSLDKVVNTSQVAQN